MFRGFIIEESDMCTCKEIAKFLKHIQHIQIENAGKTVSTQICTVSFKSLLTY